jgi:hypothetical protein
VTGSTSTNLHLRDLKDIKERLVVWKEPPGQRGEFGH